MNNKFLTQVMTAGKRIVKSNPVLPILENVSFYENHFSITSLETTLICHQRTGLKGCIDIDQFIKSLTIDPILHQEGQTAILKNGKKEVKLKVYDNSDFPVFDTGKSINCITVNTKEVLKAETLTGNDISRLWMPCVFIGNKYSNKIEIAGTDAHKIYRYNTGFSTDQKFQALLNKDTISLLKSLGAESFFLDISKGWLKLSFGVNGICFEIIQKEIDASYPNYNAVMPEEKGSIVTYNRKDLIKAIKEALPFSNKITKLVSLGEYLKAIEIDFETEYKEQLTYTGEPLERKYNGQFLINCLSLFTEDKTTLDANSRSTVINEGNETILIMQYLN